MTKIVHRTREEVLKIWVKALESGKYQQTQGMLREIHDDGTSSYCCLGVLCDLAEKDGGPKFIEQMYEEDYEFPPQFMSEFVLGSVDIASELAEMNDGGYDFRDIAKHIRENYMK